MGYQAGLPAKSENLEQRLLFEEYVSMGSSRSLKKLMEHTKRSWKTVQAWSIRFKWNIKARERDKELMETIGMETPRENVERRKLSLDIVNKMIADIAILDDAGEVVDTKIKAKSVLDLRTLIDVRDEILGVKERMEKNSKQNNQTNIDKAIFIIKK
jgi:hypothetical protein